MPPLPAVCALLLLVLLQLGCAPASAKRVNYTIDDELGDSSSGLVPTYSPAAAWALGETAGVDALQAFEGTWHAATYDADDAAPRTLTAAFSGSAVYVYHILSHAAPATAGSATLKFFLDGDFVATCVFVPSGSGGVQYNVPVYANASVPHGNHTLRVETTGPATPNVLFDYIVFTAGDGSGRNGRFHGGDHDDHDNGADSDTDSGSDDAAPTSTITDSSDSIPTSISSATPISASDTNDGQSFHGFHGGNDSTGGNGDGHHNPHGSDTTAGVIVGGTIGGLALLAIIVGTILYFHRRSRRVRPAAADSDDDEKQLRSTSSTSSHFGDASESGHSEPDLLGSAAMESSVPLPPSPPSVAHLRLGPGYAYAQPSEKSEKTIMTYPFSPYPPVETPMSASIASPPASASAKRAQRQAEIAYQIKSLEAQMEVLQAGHEPDDAPGTGNTEAAPAADGVAHDTALQAQIQVLQGEVANLRARWELEQAHPASEAPPRYSHGD